MKKLLEVCGLVLAVFIATISETSAVTIHACSNNKTGVLRGLSLNPVKCMTTETAISWTTTGVTGPQGPPGVANGISMAVHGYRLADGTISGTGFTMTYDSQHGTTTIHFDPPFPDKPHCFFISNNLSPETTCIGEALDPATAVVDCRTLVYHADPSTGDWEIDASTGAYGSPADIPFKFFCVF